MPSDKPLVAANWKMNLLRTEAHELALGVGMLADRWPEIDIALFPGFLVLGEIARGTADGPLTIGAQNCYEGEFGAYTGEVSAKQIRDLGARAVILGHSERREHFGEDLALLTKKILAARAVGLKVIYCVGESAADREAGNAQEVVSDSLSIIKELDAHDREALDIAYEPIWAIGSGKSAGPEEIAEMHALIAKELLEFGGLEDSRVLYGGSVKAENAAELYAVDGVDGFLVGGASLELESFVGILDAVAGQISPQNPQN